MMATNLDALDLKVITEKTWRSQMRPDDLYNVLQEYGISRADVSPIMLYASAARAAPSTYGYELAPVIEGATEDALVKLARQAQKLDCVFVLGVRTVPQVIMHDDIRYTVFANCTGLGIVYHKRVKGDGGS